MIGALLGIALGVVSAPLVCRLLAGHIPGAGLLQPAFSLRGILFPLVICGVCALVAGILPALNVRKIDVLASLRAAG